MKQTIFKKINGIHCLAGLLIAMLLASKTNAQPSGFFSEEHPLPVKQSLQLAGTHLLGMLNPEDYYLPYWEITIHPDYNSGMSRGWPAHNLGRWLDATFRLEESIGFKIPSKIEKAMLENVKRFFDNPDYICLNPKADPFGAAEERLVWDLHSLREGLMALTAFAVHRQNAWAIETGKKMIVSINEKLLDDGTWDLDRFDACRKRGKQVIHNLDPCDTHGRMLEAIIWFYEATGSIEAIQLADRVARWHFQNTTLPDGRINSAAKADHTHSYLGTLRGLLLYGRLTHQQKYIERVAEAYRVNVPVIIKPSGYTSHNMVVESFGETSSPGDAAQLALWLYEDGYNEFLDDADRLTRSRILPSQIRSTKTLHPFPFATGDKGRDLEKRVIGAYGGCHYHSPHGSKMPVTDVTSADVHTLIDVYKHIAVSKGKELTVLLHLDYEDQRVKVTCQRNEKGNLAVCVKREAALSIHVPAWIPSESIRLFADGKEMKGVLEGGFVRLGMIPAKTTVTMEYALPEKMTTEKDLGTEYKIYWKGDDVVDVSPNTLFYPLFKDALSF